MAFQDDQDEVVISGVGGKFPEAGNMGELAEKLFAGESLVTKDPRKLTKGYYDNLPERSGKSWSGSSLFDNTFFGISTIVSTAMDPLCCMILQRTFEALIDAGINPSELRGTNSSVFSGTCHSDSDLEWATDTRSGYGIMGRNRCMNSNRVSYWLDLHGTSVSTDSGWTNGLSNLYLGWQAIRSGKCDTALVSTANLQNHPLITIQFQDLGVLSPDGLSKTFDDSANGFGRSSAVVVLVLQRASIARRNYATIGHIYSTCFGNRDSVVHKPSQKEWEQLFKEFYEKANIDIKDVNYIEAYGSSIRDEDAEELNAITEFFCKDRKTPLLTGCIKSNLGHSEASSSFCSIVKSIISFESGSIPQNLHYKNPNSLCPGLAKGQIKVVDKNTPLPGGWIAINSHGLGGTYGHIVLKPNLKTKTLKYDNIPRLVLLADRTNDFMDELLGQVESVPYDLEFISLLHEVHSRRVDKYLARGYTILPKKENAIHEHQEYGEEKRPVWFVFSGMGSQWPTMGKRLMDLPTFRESIEKSHKLLQTKGLDLINIITSNDPAMFDNILHSFVGIAAIQVALVDVLRALKITPDGLIGHSVGELGCAYADGCFTAEEMVLAAYYRGRASTETELIKGSMAAVGKGYNGIKDQLPEGVEVACHNSEDSCTLSGPIDLIHKFVAELKESGVFAKSVNVSNIAYHSRYIRPAAPKLLAYLKQVVTNPKPRSSKWISTSNPESKWDTETAKYCSAEYHTNNLLSPVLFEEGSKHIPKNAICIEIAPHGLLQAILKRSLGEKVTNIPLTSRSSEDPLIFLLQAIGKMYMSGIDPCVINLYPRIEYPVSRGTQTLHNMVHWHEQYTANAVTPMEKKVIYSFKNRLVHTAGDGAGYIFNNQNIYPLSVFLELAWEIFASIQKKPTEECPVVFENFHLEHELPVHLSDEDNVIITVEKGSGKFEFTTDHLLASVTMSLMKEKPSDMKKQDLPKKDLVGDEVYVEMKRKGYDVGDSFKNLAAVSLGQVESFAEVPLNVNWVQSIESIIQLFLLQKECPPGFLNFCSGFQRLEISCMEHIQHKNTLNSNFTVTYDPITSTATCGGIKIKGMKSIEVPKFKTHLKFPTTNFYPFVNPCLENSLRFADFCFGVALDDYDAVKNLTVVSIMEVTQQNQTQSIGLHLQKMFCDFKVKIKTVPFVPVEVKDIVDFVIVPVEHVEKCIPHLIDGGFVLLKTSPSKKCPAGFNVIGKFQENANEEYHLLKKVKAIQKPVVISTEGCQGQLINTLRDFKPSDDWVYVVINKEPIEGVSNCKKRLQAETAVHLRWIFILDDKAPKFDAEDPFYKNQLKKGLSTNIYKNSSWGGYCEYNFFDSAMQEDVNFTLEAIQEIVPKYVSFNLEKNILKIDWVEFSGTVHNRKVMGISGLVNKKKIAGDRSLTWEIPESWSLEDAASIPMAYSLAYYCLVVAAKTRKSERVMVTDGMTSIGLASIAIALPIASRVYVTVNDEVEAASIRKLFPQLKESDIIIHKDVKFSLYWKLRGQEEYAEVIINQLEGEKFFSMLDCTGQYGRIFNFGKQDVKKNVQLGSSIFLLSVSMHFVEPEMILKLSEVEKKAIHELISKGIKDGTVKPLPRVVVSLNELKKIQSRAASTQHRIKTLLSVDTIKPNSGYVRFDTKSSYLVFGDETDVWIDVAEWLVDRNAQNIIINYRDNTKRTHLRLPHLKKNKNVQIYNQQDVKSLLQQAQKLGPISAVYYVSMKSTDASQTLQDLDKYYKDPNGHFIAITKTQGVVSEICVNRNKSNFPSTNFIYDADEVHISDNLEFMSKICGKDSVIYVSLPTALLTSERKLVDLIPSNIDDFCELGSCLRKEVRLTPLNTMTGINRDNVKEFTPLIFIPGLQQNPVQFCQSIVENFLYPAFCVQIPDIKLPLSKMATFILPEIVKCNKRKVFNIVGISWGTHLALEVTRQLEEMGAVVGLILIEGPLLNAKALITKSLELDLINLIQGYSKTAVKIQTEALVGKTWQAQLNKVLAVLNLPKEKEKDFCRAATFLYNNIWALLNQDISTLNIKGPLTVAVSGEQSYDDKIIWKLCKNISVQCLPVSSAELLTSNGLWKLIHGSAVSLMMSESTIYSCFYPLLEEFLSQRIICKLGQDFEAAKVKFSFTC